MGIASIGIALLATAAAVLGMPRIVWMVVAGLGLVALLVAALIGEPDDTPGPSVSAGSGAGNQRAIASGRDSYAAGRDITIVAPSADPDRAKRLRWVRDEVAHIQRRLGQLEQAREEWGSIWPTRESPFQPLPAERWNSYGASLGLPETDHDVIQDAYEMANEFNVTMGRGPSTFGDPEPDLESLQHAFDRAASAVNPAKQQTRARSAANNPYSHANLLQSEHERKQLRVAMRTVGETELHNLVRPRLVELMRCRATAMPLATAQWTKYEDRIIQDASNESFQAANAAYGSLINLHRDLALENRDRALNDEEIERVRECLDLVETAVEALRRDTP